VKLKVAFAVVFLLTMLVWVVGLGRWLGGRH